MKLTNTATQLFFAGALSALTSTSSTVSATAVIPFENPNDWKYDQGDVEVSVTIHNGRVCDADPRILQGESDAYVKVWVGGKYCGRTSIKEDTASPSWQETIHCGAYPKSDFPSGGLPLKMEVWDSDSGLLNPDDALGRGTITYIKYGERRSQTHTDITCGSDCNGGSTIYYTANAGNDDSLKFCVQENGPDTHFRRDSIVGSMYEINLEIEAMKDAGYAFALPGDVVEVGGETVKITDSCCNIPYEEITFCTRCVESVGDFNIEVIDKDLADARIALLKAAGIFVAYPGASVHYRSQRAILNKDCTVTPDTPSSYGDPHFRKWDGNQFDFHGGCDLVLLQNPTFKHGLGMNIHVRTTIHSWWSSISRAAIQLGEDILEITGGNESIKYWINGQEKELETGISSLGDFALNFRRVNQHQSITRVDLGNRADAISIETYKHFVRINIKDQKKISFEGSSGLLGTYPFGDMIARDGKTKIQDENEFGQEWMVKPVDKILFSDVRATKDLPVTCAMPAEKKDSRRLGEASTTITEEDAATACAHTASMSDRDSCINDVLALMDTDIAGSY